MRRQILKKSVDIRGRNLLGNLPGGSARLILEPTGRPGWFWSVKGRDVPLHPRLVHYEHHRLALKYQGHELHIFEHLGALRLLLGLDGIRIINEGSYLPYDGTARIFYEAIAPYLADGGELDPMPRPLQQTVRAYGRFARTLELDIRPSEDLVVDVHIDYADFGGKYRVLRHIGGTEDHTDIIYSKPLGQPSWIKHLLRPLYTIGAWPHYNGILWEGEQPREETLRMLALHRTLDLLGALSVIPGPGQYLTGIVSSLCGNHQIDVQLLSSMNLRY